MPQLPPSILNQCSLHEWEGLQSRLLFGFERKIQQGQADGSYIRRVQYGAVLVQKGWYEMRTANQRLRAQPGQWIFSFTERHSQQLSPRATILALRMANVWSDQTPLFVPPRKLLVVRACDHPEIETLARELVNSLGPVGLFPENPIYTSQQRSRMNLHDFARHQRLLMDWLELMARVLPQYGVTLRFPKGIDPRLAKAMDIIGQLSRDAMLSHKHIEQHCGLTMQQLDRLCRRSFGVTLRQYWNHLRIQKVKHQLRRSSTAVKQVAAEMGFVQLSHFSAWFKNHAGVSPRTYRELQSGERVEDLLPGMKI